MDSTFDFEATRIPQIKQNKGFGLQNKPEQIHMIEIYPIPYHASVGKIFQELLEFPPIKLPKLSGYAIWCWGYRGHKIYHPNQQSLDPAVSIRQHITKKPSEIVYLNLRKASVIQVMAILPNSRPSTGFHPSTHNQETFGNRVPQPSKSIRYTSYGDTPELPPQYWVASRLSHQRTA